MKAFTYLLHLRFRELYSNSFMSLLVEIPGKKVANTLRREYEPEKNYP